MPQGSLNLAQIKGKVPQEVFNAFNDLHVKLDGVTAVLNNLKTQMAQMPTTAQLSAHATRIENALATLPSFDHTVAGVSSGSKQQASVLPIVVGTMTYTSTSSTITWYWDGTNGSTKLTIFWPDNSITNVPPANFGISALSASTTYNFYPYFDQGYGGVKFAQTPSGSGAPPAAFVGSNAAAQTIESADGHVPVHGTTMTAATTSSGSGSGSGGGSGGACVAEDTEILALAGKALTRFLPCSYWFEIETLGGHRLRAVPSHRIFTEEGCQPLTSLSNGAGIVTMDGISPLRVIRGIKEAGKKLMVWVPKGNLYWSNRILSHNLKAF